MFHIDCGGFEVLFCALNWIFKIVDELKDLLYSYLGFYGQELRHFDW